MYLKADPELLRLMRSQAEALWTIARLLHRALTDRNAKSVEFGPLQIIDKPKE